MCAGGVLGHNGGEVSRWQEESGEAQEVLYEVFSQLTGTALATVAGVCRAWRRAAGTPALWRHLLLRDCSACHTTIRQLVELEAAQNEGECVVKTLSWRDEYVRAAAGWLPRYSWQAAEGAVLEHATLDATGRALAIAADNASVAVWDISDDADTWSVRWRIPLGTRRGWFTAARVEWSANGARLLAAGALHLAARWELIVLASCDGRVLARAACSAGGAGCWAGSEAFLSLELRLAAPSHATTAVWLNAATQETQSEHTGVTAPLLRIYNEGHTAISHMVVVDVHPDGVSLDGDRGARCDDSRVLVVACGKQGGELGVASALCGWLLPRILAPPPLCAAASGDLRTRLARRRAAIAAEEEEEELDEAAVRAPCTAPHYMCDLASRVLGIVVHDNNSLWVQVSDGRVLNLSLPVLVVQRSVSTMGVPRPLTPIYVLPAATTRVIAAPQHDGQVCVWTLPCTARAKSIPPPAPCTSTRTPPAVAVLAPCVSRCLLLVLTGPHIHVWENRATIQYL